MHRLALSFVLAACTTSTGSQPVPEASGVPSFATFVELRDAAQAVDHGRTQVLVVDLRACPWQLQRGSTALSSGFALSYPSTRGCVVWIGGESENPDYDGSPHAYCRLPRDGTFHVGVPVGTEDARCTRLYGPVPDRATFEEARAGAPVRDGTGLVAIEVEVCAPERRTLGGDDALVTRSHGQRCEVYFEREGEPYGYCALQRRGTSRAVPLTTDPQGRPTLDDPLCFTPAFD